MMINIITIIGARPQFIKAAAFSRITSVFDLQEEIIHTGQHYDSNMSGVFFEELNIPKPSHNLEVGSLTHGAQTAKMLEGIEKILIKKKPELVLVYGDTNSTLAGALAAAKLNIPVAHVEAGLRSFNKRMPEEINRILTDHCSDILFCPTENAVKNLLGEGIPSERIKMVGDIMFDACLYYKGFLNNAENLSSPFNYSSEDYCLVTIHRAENTDDPQRIKNILYSLIEISKDIQIIFPVHPRTMQYIQKNVGKDFSKERLKFITPVGYKEMLILLKDAKMVMTDSGGLQKEAYFFEKPCITLRDETEWVELVENGYNFLCSPENPDKIFSTYSKVRTMDIKFNKYLYGSGDTALKIGEVIQKTNL